MAAPSRKPSSEAICSSLKRLARLNFLPGRIRTAGRTGRTLDPDRLRGLQVFVDDQTAVGGRANDSIIIWRGRRTRIGLEASREELATHVSAARSRTRSLESLVVLRVGLEQLIERLLELVAACSVALGKPATHVLMNERMCSRAPCSESKMRPCLIDCSLRTDSMRALSACQRQLALSAAPHVFVACTEEQMHAEADVDGHRPVWSGKPPVRQTHSQTLSLVPRGTTKLPQCLDDQPDTEERDVLADRKLLGDGGQLVPAR